jgi:lactonase family protein with 7-bladed beta-propeller
MSAAATFVYVSDAEDAAIDAYVMDTKTGALTSIGKAEAGKTVMPMAVAPNNKFLYAVVRSQPMRVVAYAIDGKTGALTEKATAPLPDSMAYVSTDRSGRFLFTASYGGDKVAVSPIGSDGLVTAEAIQICRPAAMRIQSWRSAATTSSIPPILAPIRCCNSPSMPRAASSRRLILRRSSQSPGTARATWRFRATTNFSMC